VVRAAGDEQRRAAVVEPGVDGGRGGAVEVGRGDFERRPSRARDGPAVEKILRLRRGQRVAEAEAELPAFSEIARSRLPGRLSAADPDRSWTSGIRRTPLIWPGLIATAAAAVPWASSFWAIRPPRECPMTIGLAGSAAISFV